MVKCLEAYIEDAMNAPAEFVALRHLIGHGHDSPAEVAKHSGLIENSVRLVLHRLRREGVWAEPQLFERLRSAPRKPDWREFRFQIPNPANWHQEYKGPYLLSGEVAAAELDRMDLVPSQHLIYVPAREQDRAIQAAWDAFAKFAPNRDRANLVIRIADPWLQPDPADERFAERGQRLLDYAASRNIQMLRGMTRGAAVLS